MGTIDWRERTRPVDRGLHEALVAKCQENGWLKRGGYDWQDDPWLEEYPYEFVEAEDVSALRGFLGCGNWAIRTGIVYDDLAFIQQVNGGDEWWTLKKAPVGWEAFESWTFGGILERGTEFERAVASMQMATPEECLRLDYMLPETESPLDWRFVRTEGIAPTGEVVPCRAFVAKTAEGYEGRVFERPGLPGFCMEVRRTDPPALLLCQEGVKRPLGAAALCERVLPAAAAPGSRSLSDAVRSARGCSDSLPQRTAAPARTAEGR